MPECNIFTRQKYSIVIRRTRIHRRIMLNANVRFEQCTFVCPGELEAEIAESFSDRNVIKKLKADYALSFNSFYMLPCD